MKKPDPVYDCHQCGNRYTHGDSVERLIVAFELANPEASWDRHIKLCARCFAQFVAFVANLTPNEKEQLQAAAKGGRRFLYRRTAPTNRFVQ